MLAEDGIMTEIKNKHTPSHPKDDGVDVTEFINEWGKAVLLPISGGAIIFSIGNSSNMDWLSAIGFIAIAWGLYGIYERVSILRAGIPLIVIGAVAALVFYTMHFWLGVMMAGLVVVLGGYNLYGRIVGAANNLLESGVEAAESKVVNAAQKKKTSQKCERSRS